MEQFGSFYSKKRILITGGAGFIGSHLVEKLVSLGARVTILDNFSTGSLANLKSVAHAISVIYADVRSAYTCIKATTNHDIVFHLAAFISVPESITKPEYCHAINTTGTKNMLEGCIKNNVSSLVFSSSSAVYGNKNNACTESDALSPETPYASSKLDAETLCSEYSNKHNLNTTILRYFNVYGERQNPNGPYAAVVARFKQQLIQNQPITIFGDGKQTRDFINVSEVVNANLYAGMQTNVRSDIFNIGTGKSLNLLQLISQLEQELNVAKSEITFLPARQGDILHSIANCEKYKNWQTSSSF